MVKRNALIPKEPVVHMNVRLPRSLHRAIKRAAEDHHTSLHSEILLRLTLPVTRQDVFDRLNQLIFDLLINRADSDGQQASTARAPAQNGPTLPLRQSEGEA